MTNRESEPGELSTVLIILPKPGWGVKINRINDILETGPISRVDLIGQVYKEEIEAGVDMKKVKARFDSNFRSLERRLKAEGRTIGSYYYTQAGKKGEFAAYYIGYRRG